MSISSEVRKAGPFTGNGVTTAFPFTFKVFAESDVLVVRADDATSIETVLALTTDYTVSLNANQNTNPGGTVTLLAPLATGTSLIVSSDIQNLQPTDLTNQGGFYPAVINNALDRATIQIQQLQEQVDRSAKLPITSAVDVNTLSNNIAVLAAIEADISTVAGIAPNVDTVAGISANVTTVAGISGNVTTVAGISANVTAVAGNEANVNTVATNIANVNTVATNIANVNATGANIANVNTVAAISADVTSVAADQLDIGTVSANIANVNTVAGISGNVTTVAGISADVTNLSGVSADVTALAAQIPTFTSFAKLGDDQTFTGAQRGAVTTDNDLSFDLNTTNNFSCTPTGTGTLTFTNITAGQSGFILLDNSGGHAISAAATTKVGASTLGQISAAGVYLLSYFSNGTNVYVVNSGALA